MHGSDLGLLLLTQLPSLPGIHQLLLGRNRLGRGRQEWEGKALKDLESGMVLEYIWGCNYAVLLELYRNTMSTVLSGSFQRHG